MEENTKQDFIKKSAIIVLINLIFSPLYFMIAAHGMVSKHYFPDNGMGLDELFSYGLPIIAIVCVLTSIFLIHKKLSKIAALVGGLPAILALITVLVIGIS